MVMKNCVICGTEFDAIRRAISCSDVCKKARKNEQQRNWKANRTDEQIAKHNQRTRDWMANRTDEQIAQKRQRDRDRRANRTDEQIARDQQRIRDWQANMTDEQREQRNFAELIRYHTDRRDAANFGLQNAIQDIINLGATQ